MKYRVRKIWFDGGAGAKYDLDQLSGKLRHDLISYACKEASEPKGVVMSGRSRPALYLLLEYEINTHDWGRKWTSRTAADVLSESNYGGFSSSAMKAHNILDELCQAGLMRHGIQSKVKYWTINYEQIAEVSKVEFIPEAYNVVS